MRPRASTLAFLGLAWLTGLREATYAQGSGEYQKLVTQYRASCHNDCVKTGRLSLDGLDPSRRPERKRTQALLTRSIEQRAGAAR